MLLLLTGSYDGTADRLVLSYGPGVFRLNYDLWRDYNLAFSDSGWTISSPAGHEISSETVTRAYWWKAFSYFTQDDRLIKSEVKYIFRDIYGWCQARGLSKGNSIDFHNRLGKLTIIGYAKEYFAVPRTLATINGSHLDLLSGQPAVAKSLSSELSDSRGALMTTEVDTQLLDLTYPWYLQAKIDSEWDVTVFYCGGRSFPFRRSRSDLKGLDWRAEQNFETLTEEWEPMATDPSFHAKIRGLSKKLSVEFGRYDFMTVGNSSELMFLEFNANGQWVFLDPFDKHGLLSCVTEWLKS